MREWKVEKRLKRARIELRQRLEICPSYGYIAFNINISSTHREWVRTRSRSFFVAPLVLSPGRSRPQKAARLSAPGDEWTTPSTIEARRGSRTSPCLTSADA